MALHLFNSHVAKELKPGLTSGSYHFLVDLYEVGQAGRKRARTYHFLRRFPLDYEGMPWPPTQFAVQFVWLNPREKTGPMLMFNNFALGETSLAVGDKIVSVFVNGWTHKLFIQKFDFDDGAGSGAVSTASVEISDKLDQNSQVQIMESEWTPPSGPTHSRFYNWNGQHFVPSAEETVESTPIEP